MELLVHHSASSQPTFTDSPSEGINRATNRAEAEEMEVRASIASCSCAHLIVVSKLDNKSGIAGLGDSWVDEMPLILAEKVIQRF